jgi:hypothetical protein
VIPLAHHMGEEALPGLLGAGATAVPVLAVIVRQRIRRIGEMLRRLIM